MEKKSEWRQITDPLYKTEYLALFGLKPEQETYFADKNIIDHTPLHLFDDVIRSALLHYAAPRTGVVLTSLRIKFAKIDLIYGYVHSYDDQPQFYNMAGSLISQDGEYRKDLVPMRQMNVSLEAFPQVFGVLIPHISGLIKDGLITVEYEHFPKDSTVNLGLIPTYVLAVAWLCDYFMTDIGVVDKHLYGQRAEMTIQFPGAAAIYSQIKSLKGLGMAQFISCTKYPDSRPASTNCGQKLIPLLRTEIGFPFDIVQQVWREIYINEAVSTLMMNNIALGFAFTAGWYYIRGAGPSMYDNPAMRAKYANSAVAGEIIGDLKDAAKHTERSGMGYPSDDPRHDIQTPIDDTFGHLRNDILRDIGFVNSHLRLSDYAICMVSVHTNVTFSNISILANINKATPLLDLPIFSRLVFDVLYSLYCLNTRIGAMHSDLHINNATVMRLQTYGNVEFGNTAYVIGDDIYSLRYDGFIGCVIDFSRGVLGDTDRLAGEFDPITIGQLRTQQLGQMTDLVERHFPDIWKIERVRLTMLGEDDPVRLFRLCSIIDAYSFSKGLWAMFQSDERYAHCGETLGQFAADIAAATEEIFMAELETIHAATPPPEHWPMLALIRRMYREKYRIDWPPPVRVSHVVNSNNPLKYDIDKPENWNRIVHPKIALDACRKIPGRDCSNYISANYDYVQARRAADLREIDQIAQEYRGGRSIYYADDDIDAAHDDVSDLTMGDGLDQPFGQNNIYLI